MKVPGFGEICPRPMPFENISPLIEMAIEAFGARRLMWGSNFPPVAGRGEGYGNALFWPMERIKFKSEEDKEWVFGKTAMSLWTFGE
jgi:L-fuconolactonase